MLTVEEMTAADVNVGQRWRHMTTHAANRTTVWTIASIDEDRVALTAPGLTHGRTTEVTLGMLLANWVPVG